MKSRMIKMLGIVLMVFAVLNFVPVSLSETATLDDLQRVIDDAYAKMLELRQVTETDQEALSFSGSGSEIIMGVDLKSPPYKVHFETKNAKRMDVDYLSEGGSAKSIIFNKAGEGSVELLLNGKQDILIETSDDWNLDFVPLTKVGNIDFTGSGAAVSDIFTVKGLTMLAVEYKRTGYDVCTISLFAKNDGKWELEDVWFLEDPGMGNVVNKKLIVKVSKEVDCFLSVDVDKGPWTIKSVGE